MPPLPPLPTVSPPHRSTSRASRRIAPPPLPHSPITSDPFLSPNPSLSSPRRKSSTASNRKATFPPSSTRPPRSPTDHSRDSQPLHELEDIFDSFTTASPSVPASPNLWLPSPTQSPATKSSPFGSEDASPSRRHSTSRHPRPRSIASTAPPIPYSIPPPMPVIFRSDSTTQPSPCSSEPLATLRARDVSVRRRGFAKQSTAEQEAFSQLMKAGASSSTPPSPTVNRLAIPTPSTFQLKPPSIPRPRRPLTPEERALTPEQRGFASLEEMEAAQDADYDVTDDIYSMYD